MEKLTRIELYRKLQELFCNLDEGWHGKSVYTFIKSTKGDYRVDSPLKKAIAKWLNDEQHREALKY